MNMFRVLFFLLAGAALLNFAPAASAQEEDKPITHNVSVNMLLLPVYVTGADGEPVYDLKKEDFQLYAGGVPMKIQQFFRYDFEHREEVSEEVMVKGKPVRIQRPSRAVFVIIDAVFNRFQGYRRSKKIAVDIIRNSSPGDICIALENRANGVLHYIGGPETTKKILVKRIKKLHLPSQRWNQSLHYSYNWVHTAENDPYSPLQNQTHGVQHVRLQQIEKMDYKNQAYHTGDLMSRFKYVLKAVTRPKVVFLVSEGISKAAFREMEARYGDPKKNSYASPLLVLPTDVDETNAFREKRMFLNLERMVKSINEGGSVLYTINPGKVNGNFEAAGEMSLRYLAYQSGGEYIAGSDTRKIIKKIRRSTSAYYELAFTPTADLGKNFKVDLKCKRDGVTVHTFKSSEVNTPYYRMEPMEKKLFAFNMAVGGNWSRMVGKVVRIQYHRVGKRGAKTQDTVRVTLPPKMQNKDLDIFSIRLDRKTRKVDIDMITRKVGDTADLVLKSEKDKAGFFVIIEPVFAYCIYNRV